MSLDNYHILKSLSAKQQFGKLYLAEEIVSSKKVVIKSVRKIDLIAYQRLLNEAKWHFNKCGLPTILEEFEDEYSYIIVKPFIEGVTVDQFIDKLKNRQLNKFLLDFTIRLNELLLEIHSNNIVHCDLKPGNILVSGKVDSFEVHIIDFGLAIDMNDIEERKMLFPLGYAAPELILNRLHLISPKSDIFSVGILFWRLIAGKLPLAHPNPSIFTNLQLTHPLPEHSGIRNKLHKILLKLTNKHSFKLPPNKMSINEVDQLLKEAIESRPDNLNELINYFDKVIHRKLLW